VNGNMKAYAAWYLFARLAGWEGPDTAGTTWVTSIEILGEGGNAEISTPQGTLQMTANVTPDDAGDTTIIWSVINGTGQATITQDGLLQAVANGMVTVVATANDGSGVEATLQVTITNQSTGISSYQKPDDKGSTRVFPNPASDHIQVIGDLEFPSFMRIYDMTGQLVREERIESGEQPVDVSGLKQGLFIIRLVGRNTERTAGFMKK
jgi:hypothetical protein